MDDKVVVLTSTFVVNSPLSKKKLLKPDQKQRQCTLFYSHSLKSYEIVAYKTKGRFGLGSADTVPSFTVLLTTESTLKRFTDAQNHFFVVDDISSGEEFCFLTNSLDIRDEWWDALKAAKETLAHRITVLRNERTKEALRIERNKKNAEQVKQKVRENAQENRNSMNLSVELAKKDPEQQHHHQQQQQQHQQQEEEEEEEEEEREEVAVPPTTTTAAGTETGTGTGTDITDICVMTADDHKPASSRPPSARLSSK